MTAAAVAAKLLGGRNCTSLSSLHPVFPVTVARMERQRNPAVPVAARAHVVRALAWAIFVRSRWPEVSDVRERIGDRWTILIAC